MVCNLFDNNNETCHFLCNKCQNIIKTCCLETKVTRLFIITPSFLVFVGIMIICYTAKALYQAMP